METDVGISHKAKNRITNDPDIPLLDSFPKTLYFTTEILAYIYSLLLYPQQLGNGIQPRCPLIDKSIRCYTYIQWYFIQLWVK